MQSIGQLSGPQAVAKCKEVMTVTEETSETLSDSGRFLPISVCASQGFDTHLIQMHTPAKDRMIHPVLGECFRVAILETGNNYKRSNTRGTAVSANVGGGVSSTELGGAPSEPSDDDDESSSSSSDSSSSSSSRKKRKSKKGKKNMSKDSKKKKKSKKEKHGKKRRGAPAEACVSSRFLLF